MLVSEMEESTCLQSQSSNSTGQLTNALYFTVSLLWMYVQRVVICRQETEEKRIDSQASKRAESRPSVNSKVEWD